jgi:hypothetical protein
MTEALAKTPLRYGIPDIALPRSGGGTVNPATFVGHSLLVVFCPTDTAAEAAALNRYLGPECDLTGYDAWLIVVGEKSGKARTGKAHPLTARDPKNAAWNAFVKLARPESALRRDEGASFLFARGGSLQRVWKGAAAAAEVMDELAQRISFLVDPPATLNARGGHD